MSDNSDDEALQYFNDFEKEQDQAIKQDSVQHEPEERSRKRLKKHKKDKKKKKKRHIEEEQLEQEFEEENDYDDGVRSFIEEQASEDSDEESAMNSSAQYEWEQQRKYLQKQYKVNEKKYTDNFWDRIEGKNADQINRLYQQKVHKRRENEAMLPSARDFQMFYVGCKQGKEEQLVMSILNKTAYYQSTKNEKYKMELGSVMALKKKYPGKLFIEAQNEKVIKESLQSFIDVNTSRVTPMDHEFYANIFEAKENKEVQWREQQYVRIKKGVYEGDLAKIIKVKKNNVDVMIVPRINIQDILIKMKEETAKNHPDQKTLIEKKDEILRRYTNHRMYYPPHLRPPKKILPMDAFKQFGDLPSNKKFNFTSNGLILMNFRFDEFGKPEGTMLPVELQYFSKTGNIADEILNDEDEKRNFSLTIKIEKGEEVEVVSGQLTGAYGIVVEVKEKTAALKCKNKEMLGKIIEEPIDHICKRFKVSQRVKVVSGTEKGKTGIIIKVDGPYAQIWTDNQNSIKINKNNLEVYMGETVMNENLLGLKKDDLIKTTKGNVGIVITTNKDNIKILDLTNVISIVNNLDYESKMNSRGLVAKNKFGDQIKNQTIVRVRSGVHQGVRCEVKHIYRDYLFLFNPEFDKTSGLAVEKADNCNVVAKNLDRVGKGNMRMGSKPNFGTEDEDLKIGKSITIGSGPLKGYRGVIKSINKDRIEVRIPQKNCTEWIQRDKITQTDNNLDHGKTPRRGISMTAMYAQSPMNF